MPKATINRLFVPLGTLWYELFASGKKTYELRAISSRYNEKTVRTGRRVEIRRGYQYDPLWGTIGHVETSKSINTISMDIIDKVVPRGISNQFLNEYEQKYKHVGFIVFEIKLDKIK